MKNKVLLVILTMLFAGVLSFAQEAKKIPFRELPAAIQKEIASLKHPTEFDLIEDGNTSEYEVKSKRKGKNKDITLSSNGILMKIKQDLPLSQLPSETRERISNDYPTIDIKEIESVTLYYYEIKGVVDGKNTVIRVCANGHVEDGPEPFGGEDAKISRKAQESHLR